LELIGAPIAETAAADGVVRVAVALDRRVWCRLEPRERGIEIHSRDTGERTQSDDALDIAAGPAARVARVLAVSGLRSGVRVVTQVRVPSDAGLGTEEALEVALLAVLGRNAEQILAGLSATNAPSPGGFAESDRHAAVLGGAHALRWRSGSWKVEHVATDPARLEECLVLADPDPAATLSVVCPPTAESTAAARVVEALNAGAHHEVASILAEIHRGRFDQSSLGVRSLAGKVVEAGGAAWPCGRLVAIWAAPGARGAGAKEAVLAALKEARVRSFAARVDLRGLEVE
jgi:hypothetical protein